MDCNKCTSWDEYSDLSEEESKQNEDQFIIDAKILLFLRKYTSFPLKVKYFFNSNFLFSQKEELIEVFVQSNFDEETINLILEKKLIEKQQSKKGQIKENKENEDETKINQSKNDSWKEHKENNIKYKNHKNKGHNNYSNHHKNHYNHSNNFFYNNKKHYKDYKDYKNYKFSNKPQGKDNKPVYVEKEIEINSKGETEGDSERKASDNAEENNLRGSLDYNLKNLDLNTKENKEEINSLENYNLDLIKSQSEDLSEKNIFDLQDIGIKLFPGAFRYKKKNYENNLVKENRIIKNNDLECNNYLCKPRSNIVQKEQKNGLELAFDYYSSFLEDKI